ncbi:2-methoxy-6-polyprenyl-14-benzoquinol methylase mitochondrial [Zea mays]|uniref:2-methoxy-6-polyprenyl-14-benzoquinol methylase mitochondrial n=1 Tax=Zea mays TaxID=4577 RepID=A0A1D6JF83_MAIZE|nr:2-methoxy-6-polyprenyl-14-benzoquinol methylase mitochondrial [Zea mays]AQK46441.1 2-methoxy-6-polyprenyl-14-benzoquinol methylase mitochondrial [Zea mays]
MPSSHSATVTALAVAVGLNGKCAYMLLIAVRLASSKLWDLMKWQVFVVCVSLIKGTHIYVCDINPNMLNVGKKCVAERGYSEEHCLSWIQGDAEALSFEDGSMDGYTIAFGIRNVTHIEKALSEAYRSANLEP